MQSPMGAFIRRSSTKSNHLSTCHHHTMIVVHNRTASRQQRTFGGRVRPNEIVKVENGEPAENQLRRVTKWVKRSFQWCIQAVSLRCLRRPKRAVFAVQGPPAYSCAPAQRPTYESLYQGSLRSADTDDEDDSEMRMARQAAAEIEWHIKEAESLTTQGIQKRIGLWSNDEHERYCRGLEKYRYGSWKLIADYVGTRTERQVLSHAQSIRAKRKRTEEREQCEQTEVTTSRTGGVNKNARATAVGPNCLPNLRLTRSLVAAPTGLCTPTSNFKPVEGVAPDELVPTHLENEYPTQFTLEDLDISSDVLLCSPSLDILLGIAVSDEDFIELLDIPSDVQPPA